MASKLDAMVNKQRLKVENQTSALKTMSMEQIVNDVKYKIDDVKKMEDMVSLLEKNKDEIEFVDAHAILESVGAANTLKTTEDTLRDIIKEANESQQDEQRNLKIVDDIINPSVADTGDDTDDDDDDDDPSKKPIVRVKGKVKRQNQTMDDDIKKALLVLLAAKQHSQQKQKQQGGATLQPSIPTIMTKKVKENLVDVMEKIRGDTIKTLEPVLKPVVLPIIDEWCKAPNTNNSAKKLGLLLDSLIYYNNVVDNFRVSVKIDFISLFRNVIKPEEIDKIIKQIKSYNTSEFNKLTTIFNVQLAQPKSQTDKTTLEQLQTELEDAEDRRDPRSINRRDERAIQNKIRAGTQDIKDNDRIIKEINIDLIKKMDNLNKQPKDMGGITVNTIIKEKLPLKKIEEIIVYPGAQNKVSVSLHENPEIAFNLLGITKPTLKFGELFKKILIRIYGGETYQQGQFKHLLSLFKLLDEFKRFNNTVNYNKLVYYLLVPYLYLFSDINIINFVNKLNNINFKDVLKNKTKYNKKVAPAAGEKYQINVNNNPLAMELNEIITQIDRTYPFNDRYTSDLNPESIQSINMNMYVKNKLMNMIFSIQNYVYEVFNIKNHDVPRKIKNKYVALAYKFKPVFSVFFQVLKVGGLLTLLGVAGAALAPVAVAAGITLPGVAILEASIAAPVALAATGSLVGGQIQEGGTPFTPGSIKFNGKDLYNLFTNREILDKSIQKIRNNYASYDLFTKEVVPQWIRLLDTYIPNEHVIYQTLMVIIYEYWITKFKQGIKLLTKENKIKTNYATDKFGASSFRGAVKSSVLSLTGLRKRMIQFGLNDLLPSIMMMTNREVNKTTLKPNALARISDDKLKLFLYKLEKDEKLRKEVVASAPSLESKLMEFIQILKKEDQADITEKEEIKKKKEESRKQEETKKQEASKQKEEKEAKSKEMKEKMKQKREEESKDVSKQTKDKNTSSPTSQSGSQDDSGKPSTPSGPSAPSGPPAGAEGPTPTGEERGIPDGAEGPAPTDGDDTGGPLPELTEDQTSDQSVSPIQTTELTGEVEKKYPEILATNVDDVFIPGETVYAPKGSNDEALISVKRGEYTQLEQDIRRLENLLKNEKLATNINKNTLKEELRNLLTMKDSLISEIRYINQRQKMNNELALKTVKEARETQKALNRRSLNKRSLIRPSEINESRIPIEDSGRKRTAKKERKKDRKNPRKKIQKDDKRSGNKRSGNKRSVKKVRASIKQLENQIKEKEKTELEKNIKQLEREINRLS
jgi:hypothetical protein